MAKRDICLLVRQRLRYIQRANENPAKAGLFFHSNALDCAP
jgi:hypothetical protein